MRSPLEVHTAKAAGPMVVTVGGELDLYTAPWLWDFLRDLINRGERHLVLDLSQLEFIGVSGVNVLVRSMRLLHQEGGVLWLRSPTSTTRRVLELAGVSAILDIEEAEEGPPARPWWSGPCSRSVPGLHR